MNERLKKIIFNKLYEDLSKVEIIHYRDSIWFVDREQKYWYFEYVNSGVLYWRYLFFNNFFTLFTLKPTEYEKIMCEWVEEVLNCKVVTTEVDTQLSVLRVEEALNCEVNTIVKTHSNKFFNVAEVLNYKVLTTHRW